MASTNRAACATDELDPIVVAGLRNELRFVRWVCADEPFVGWQTLAHFGAFDMKAMKATYENGQLTLAEPPPETGPVEVLVVFPEPQGDPWLSILAEESPRPAFTSFADECLEQIKSGQASPLKLDQL